MPIQQEFFDMVKYVLLPQKEGKKRKKGKKQPQNDVSVKSAVK